MVIFNALQTSLSGGIGRYSYELAKAIYELNEIDFKIVIRKEDKESFSFVKQEDLIVVNDIKSSRDRNYYEQFVLPQKIYKLYPEAIIHYPDSMAPIFAKNKVVITVHDLAFKSLKNVFTKKTVLWKNFITDISIKKANSIIAITNFTQKEVLKHYPKTDLSKIKVIYNGFNDFSKDKINLNRVRSKIKNITNKNYILTVSTISPRKNVDGLIRAFSLIKEHTDLSLVICGNNGWLFEDVFKLVEELKLKDRVFFTGKVDDNELKHLYKNAQIFVYPSFYEGFGLPPLEAMSYGIPTITTNRTSLPEVVGEDSLLVDPNNIKAMSLAIKKLLDSKELREEYSAKGLRRIKKFSWKKCAEEVLDFYRKIVK